jgi:hypothetical protein
MRNWGPVVIGLAVMATMALIGRGYIALDAKVPNWGDALDALVATVSAVTAVITYSALGLARKSANAAESASQAALASSQSLVRIERAYLDWGWDAPEWNGDDGRLAVQIYNHGKTPGIVTRFRVQLMDSLPEQIPDFKTFIAENIECRQTVAAADRSTFITRAIHKDAHTFIMGAAEYIDIFGGDHRATILMVMTWQDDTGSYLGPPEWNEMS